MASILYYQSGDLEHTILRKLLENQAQVIAGNLTYKTAGGGGGSGTITAGTVNALSKYTAATTLGNSLLSDDGTKLTYAGAGGFAVSSGSTAGALTLTQGTTQSPGTTNITLQAPAAVTSYVRTLEGSVGNTGVYVGTVSGTTVTDSKVAPGASGNVLTSSGTTWTSAAPVGAVATRNAQTGTTYTLAAGDANNDVSLSNAGAITLTVPLNGTIPFVDATYIQLLNLGAGLVTIHPASGVTLNGSGADVTITAQWQWATLVKIGTGTDTWSILTAQALNLTSGVSGILPTANGGTGIAYFTAAGPTAARVYTFPDAATTVAGLGTTQSFTGIQTFAPSARSSGVASYFTLTPPADTGLTTATESIGLLYSAATRTWVDGTVALQREVHHNAITYGKTTTAATFTDIFMEDWDQPVAGAGVTFTRAHTLGVHDSTSAASSITGGLVVAATYGTAATSVGIGGGNVNAGGLITGGTMTSTGQFTASSTSTFTGAATYNNAVVINGAAATTALTITNTARTSGILPYIKWTIPADTGLTTATEAPGLLAVAGTRTWVDGTVATQRENLFVAPTYNKTTTAATFTNAATLAVSAAPIAGTGVTITNPYALWVQAGITQLDGGAQMGVPAYADTGKTFFATNTIAGYDQLVVNNRSNNAAASSDLVVGNDLNTASTYYGDLGINSSTFSGTGSFSLPNATYLYSQNGDLAIGSWTSNAIHFVVANGATDAVTIGTNGLVKYSGFPRTTAGFTATSNTVLANVTALTVNVLAATSYHFQAWLPTTATTAGGIQFAVAGTATATNIIYEGYIDNGSKTRATAMAGVVCSSATATIGTASIEGSILVNAAGTLTIQFAQNTSNAAASTVLTGATFEVWQTAN